MGNILESCGITDEDLEFFDPAMRASDGVMLVMAELLDAYQPASILELGSGMSTIMFEQYSRHMDAEFLSVNEEGPWHDQYIVYLEDKGIDTSAIYAVPMKNGYYRTVDLPTLYVYDMIFVDGPKGSINRGNRRALDFIMDHSGLDTIIVHDDTHRGLERRVVHHLQKSLDYNVMTIDDTHIKRQSTVLIPKGLGR